MASKKQRILFFKLWARARRDICAGYGLDMSDSKEERAARHRWISECTGATCNINAVGGGSDFAKLMMRTAEAAGDFQEASYWCTDEARRSHHMMTHLIRQIGEITGEDHPWEYIQGIFKRMKLPDNWMDIPERDLVAVSQALDTYRRRILRRDHGWRGLRIDSRPLAFDTSITYVRLDDGTLGCYWGKAPACAAQYKREAVTA